MQSIATSPKQFILTKFEPNNILLINKKTKQPYNYFELATQPDTIQISYQLQHPSLLRPLMYGSGLLYQKGQSTLLNELENRKRAHTKQYFSQDELINTFLPLFECLRYLHSNGRVHGQVHPENILLVDGQVKMRDWLLKSEQNAYYKRNANIQKNNREQKPAVFLSGQGPQPSPKQQDDICALGLILFQFTTLKKINELAAFSSKDISLSDSNLVPTIQTIIDVYSKKLIFVLLILLKKKYQLFPEIIPLLQNDSTQSPHHLLSCIDLNGIYTKVRLEKSKRLIVKSNTLTPKQQKNTYHTQLTSHPSTAISSSKKTAPSSSSSSSAGQNNSENYNSMAQTSPSKKFNITHSKRASGKNFEDSENKKVFNEQIKKRQIDKITKIIERSNAFVNELMTRKSHTEHQSGQQVLKKISGKNNISHLGGTSMASTAMYATETTPAISSKKVASNNKQPVFTATVNVSGISAFSPNKRLRTISKKK